MEIQMEQLSMKSDSPLQERTTSQEQLLSESQIGTHDLTKLSDQTNSISEKKQIKPKLKKMIKKSDKKLQMFNENKLVLAKDVMVKGYKLYINIEINRVFPIVGDYFVNLDYGKKLQIEEQIGLFKGIKQVTLATKDDQRQIVTLDIITSDSMEYVPEFMIEKAIQSSQDPLLLQFLKIIQQYFAYISMQSKMQLLLNEYMSKLEQEELIARRRQFYDEQVEQHTQNNFSDTDFYLYYKYQQRKPGDPFLQYREARVSYPLIALLGTDPTSFTNICMRNGFLEFSSNIHKQLMIIESMACRLEQLSQDAQPRLEVKEVVLLTFDEYEIYTKMEVQCFRFEYPPELQIKVKGYQLIHEIPVFLRYMIDENTLSCLIAKRAKNPQFQSQWENEEFGYTLESQIFLEKYYKQTLENVKESKYEHQLKYYYNKECRFKTIQNQQITSTQCCQNYKLNFPI